MGLLFLCWGNGIQRHLFICAKQTYLCHTLRTFIFGMYTQLTRQHQVWHPLAGGGGKVDNDICPCAPKSIRFLLSSCSLGITCLWSLMWLDKNCSVYHAHKVLYTHLFSQNPATNTENSAQSRSEHIFMELTLFVYNINSQYFCIKSGLNYLRYKRYDRNETEGHIFFCNLNFHRNGKYILYINCYHHRKIYILHWLVVPLYIEHFWTIIYHINTFK